MSKQSRKAYWAKQRTKKAWFQGSTEATPDGQVTSNNPQTLGYPNEMGYDKAPMATTAPGGQDSRPWEQTWFMNAAAETAKVMGPKGEEFDLKKHWQRIPSDEKIANAKLSAKFLAVKASPKKSAWVITANGEPVLKATLDEIWGKELDENTAKASVTKEYARSVMAKIRQEGLAHVAYLLTGIDVNKLGKKAQFGEEMGADEALEDEAKITETELGVAGDVADEKLEEIESLETQIVEKVAPNSEAVEVFKGLQEAEVALEATSSELRAIRAKLSDRTLTASKKIAIIKLAEAAIADAVTTFEAADDVMDSGEELIPEGDMEASIEISEGGEGEVDVDANIEAAKDFLASDDEGDMNDGQMEAMDEIDETVIQAPVDGDMEALSSLKINKFVAARKARRAVLASMPEEQKYNVVPAGGTKDGADEVRAAHPNGGTDVKDIPAGGTPKDNGQRFEDGIEAQEMDLAVAVKMPKGTYSAAAKGKTTTASDSTTAADQTAKSYWVDFFSQMGPEGKAYGQALVGAGSAAAAGEVGKTAKALVEKQVTSAVAVAKAKLLRANELVEHAVAKGMIGSDIKAKMEMVNEIMNGGDAFFNSYKSAVDKNPGRRAVAADDLGIRTASVKALRLGQVEERESSEGSDLDSVLSKFNWS